MILLIDNYDSFTYNLVQRLGEIDPSLDLEVHRNDQITLDEIERKRPDASDHLARPLHAEARPAFRCAAIQRFAGKMPILGVCLGHQAIGQATGGEIVRAVRLMHGKIDRIHHDGHGLFAGPAESVRGHALSQPGDSARHVVRRFRDDRLERNARRRARDHGDPAQAIAGVRPAISSGEFFDVAGASIFCGVFSTSDQRSLSRRRRWPRSAPTSLWPTAFHCKRSTPRCLPKAISRSRLPDGTCAPLEFAFFRTFQRRLPARQARSRPADGTYLERTSLGNMLTVEEALERVLAHARATAAVRAPLTDALGLVLAEDVAAISIRRPMTNRWSMAMPFGWPISPMEAASLDVLEEIMAGMTPIGRSSPGTCSRIMTGAPIPPGADAVVMQELTNYVVGEQDSETTVGDPRTALPLTPGPLPQGARGETTGANSRRAASSGAEHRAAGGRHAARRRRVRRRMRHSSGDDWIAGGGRPGGDFCDSGAQCGRAGDGQ